MPIIAPKVRFALVTLFMVGLIVGCAHQPPVSAYDPPGFFWGLLHGYLIFFSAIGSIFMDIRIYAFPNSGYFYDLGYAIGALLAAFSTMAALVSNG